MKSRVRNAEEVLKPKTRKETGNVMVKIKLTKQQTTIHKTLHSTQLTKKQKHSKNT